MVFYIKFQYANYYYMEYVLCTIFYVIILYPILSILFRNLVPSIWQIPIERQKMDSTLTFIQVRNSVDKRETTQSLPGVSNWVKKQF